MSDWFRRQRVEWIIETVRIFKFINREHVQRKFGVSTPQASMDIRDVVADHPNLMRYNVSSKRYELIEGDHHGRPKLRVR